MFLKILQKLKKLLKMKNDKYEYSTNALSEAKYANKFCRKPKYSKLRTFVTSLTIYLLSMSIAFNIFLIRENQHLKETIERLEDSIAAVAEIYIGVDKNELLIP